MLVHIKEIVPRARRDGYAIGAFNTVNLEVTLAIIRAAVAKHSPIIVQVSETTIKYAGLKPITHIVETIAKNEAVNVPVALHLDHGKSFRSVAECINSGFSSIMIDASDLPLDENIVLTKQAVDYARKRDVWAQGEIGRVKGIEEAISVSEREASMTTPEEAMTFVQKTGVDTLAVAIGNVHGIWKMRKGVPKLDLKRLKDISREITIPLVLHGASGLPQDEIQKAIAAGITIINIDTELRLAFTETLRTTLRENQEMYDPREVLTPSIEAIQRVVEEKIEMFGSKGRA
ncbi:MAG: class II fructose-1,6-bisphosphate aldolase [bacterium]